MTPPRLEAAKALRNAGRMSEAEKQLGEALAFYRGVGATAAVREGESLLGAPG